MVHAARASVNRAAARFDPESRQSRFEGLGCSAIHPESRQSRFEGLGCSAIHPESRQSRFEGLGCSAIHPRRAGRAGSKGCAAARFILRPARRRRDGCAASKGSATAPPSTRHFLIAGEKILKTGLTPSAPPPNAFLIANICATFSPAPLRALLIGTPIRLEIDLTHSQQTRKHFLIGTIRPTFTSAPLLTHHLSLIPHHRLTSFLFDTNKPHKIIILVSLPLKTKEKQFSIRYKFTLRGMGMPAEVCPGTLIAGVFPNFHPGAARHESATEIRRAPARRLASRTAPCIAKAPKKKRARYFTISVRKFGSVCVCPLKVVVSDKLYVPAGVAPFGPCGKLLLQAADPSVTSSNVANVSATLRFPRNIQIAPPKTDRHQQQCNSADSSAESAAKPRQCSAPQIHSPSSSLGRYV